MANSKRSVWEIRFRAMKQAIDFETNNLKDRIVNITLAGNMTEEKCREFDAKLQFLAHLKKVYRDIEETNTSFIYLQCDDCWSI